MFKIGLVLLTCLVSSTIAQSAQYSTALAVYTVTFYPKTEDINAEFGICTKYGRAELQTRHREFEYKGSNYGHAILGNREYQTWVTPKNPSETEDLRIQELFKNAYNNAMKHLNFPKLPTLSEASVVTLKFADPEYKEAKSLIFERFGKLYGYTINGEAVSPILVGDKHEILPSKIATVTNFKVVRDTSRGHNGLTYLYIYSGEILVPVDNLVSQQESFRVLLSQNLLHTHFVDPYEMKRDFPQVELLPGKIHNIETIQDKVREQNVVFFHTSVSPSGSSPAGFKKFDFSVPLLIHTTVLPPNESGVADTYIPMAAKVYVNFIKDSELVGAVRGRYASDCLLGEEYTPVSSLKSEKPDLQPIRERRLVLNVRDTQTNQMLLFATVATGLGFILAAVVKRS